MKKQFIKECSHCSGSGRIVENDTCDQDPRFDYAYDCIQCDGEGTYIDEDELECIIDDVKDMIEGMVTRIRITSDAIKDCTRGQLHYLASKYRNKLDTQARALGRLEMYCANLKSFL